MLFGSSEDISTSSSNTNYPKVDLVCVCGEDMSDLIVCQKCENIYLGRKEDFDDLARKIILYGSRSVWVNWEMQKRNVRLGAGEVKIEETMNGWKK